MVWCLLTCGPHRQLVRRLGTFWVGCLQSRMLSTGAAFRLRCCVQALRCSEQLGKKDSWSFWSGRGSTLSRSKNNRNKAVATVGTWAAGCFLALCTFSILQLPCVVKRHKHKRPLFAPTFETVVWGYWFGSIENSTGESFRTTFQTCVLGQGGRSIALFAFLWCGPEIEWAFVT